MYPLNQSNPYTVLYYGVPCGPGFSFQVLALRAVGFPLQSLTRKTQQHLPFSASRIPGLRHGSYQFTFSIKMRQLRHHLSAYIRFHSSTILFLHLSTQSVFLFSALPRETKHLRPSVQPAFSVFPFLPHQRSSFSAFSALSARNKTSAFIGSIRVIRVPNLTASPVQSSLYNPSSTTTVSHACLPKPQPHWILLLFQLLYM